jgi:hypothetical protein
MAEIVELDMITRLDIPVERILKKALEKGLKNVVLAGFTEDGDEYFASSVADGGAALWLLERCKWRLMKEVDPED